MKEYTQEELAKSANLINEAMPLSLKIIEFLENSGVERDVAVVAAGIAYSSGSHSVGASLPSTIDLVRFFYRQAGTHSETH